MRYTTELHVPYKRPGSWDVVNAETGQTMSNHASLTEASHVADKLNDTPTVSDEMRSVAEKLDQFGALYEGNGDSAWVRAANSLRHEADVLEGSDEHLGAVVLTLAKLHRGAEVAEYARRRGITAHAAVVDMINSGLSHYNTHVPLTEKLWEVKA